MKIAYLVNQYPQPSHTFIRREINQLEAQGWDVTRYTIRESTSKLVDPGDQAEFKKARVVLGVGMIGLLLGMIKVKLTHPILYFKTLRLTWKIAKPSGRGFLIHLIYFAEACVLLGWCKRDKIEHIHAHFGTNSTTVAMLLNSLGGPTYSFTAHGPEEFDLPVSLSIGEKIRRSAFTVAITNFGKSQLYRWVEFAHWNKIRIIHCGVDDSFLGAPPAPLQPNKTLINIGRLSEQKGQLILVQAAALLQQRGIDFQVNIIGDGDFRPQIEALIAEQNLQSRVHLLGFRNGAEVRKMLDESRAMVLPSFAEGLPVVIMESLARHRPVIATAIAGIPDLVKTGETGWLISAGDEVQLADAMEQALAADNMALARMGAAGAKLVELNHNAATEAAHLGKLFKEVK